MNEDIGEFLRKMLSIYNKEPQRWEYDEDGRPITDEKELEAVRERRMNKHFAKVGLRRPK